MGPISFAMFIGFFRICVPLFRKSFGAHIFDQGSDAVADQKDIREAAFMLVPGHDPFGIPDLSDPTWALFR